MNDGYLQDLFLQAYFHTVKNKSNSTSFSLLAVELS